MKKIITLDRADSPYGYPQANEQGYLTSSKVSGPFGNDSVISASYALTASFALNGGGGGGNIDTGSFATTGSNIFSGSQTISGSIILNTGAQITSTLYGNFYPGAIDIVAGPDNNSYASLTSNNTQSFVFVTNDGAYVQTSGGTYQWEFRDDGYFVIPQVQSLTKQAGILSAGDIIIQADESQSWRFSSGSGILYAPGGIEAPSFTGSLHGTASWAESASWSPSQTLQQVTTAGSSSTNPINLLNSDSTFASVRLYNYAYVGGNSGRGVGEFLTLGDSASVKIEPPSIYFKSSIGGVNALSFPGAGGQYNYLPDNSGTLVLSVNGNTADSAGNVVLAVSPATASVDQINVGEPGDLFVRAGELEQSKHSTLNIFNFLNFT